MNTRQIQRELSKDQLDFQSKIIIERDKKIREIDQGVIDVNYLMKDFKALVDQQGMMIDNIVINIEKTKEHVDRGVKDLKIAEKHQSRCSIL